MLNAGWYEDAKIKADKAYEDAKVYTDKKFESVNESYKSTQTYVNDSYADSKKKYDDYNKEKQAASQAKLNTCIRSLEERLPQYGLFLEQNYMDVNKRNEAKILLSYRKLNNKGISSKLQSVMNESTLKKLTSSTSALEYTNIILSELKKIQKKLKQNDPANLDNLIQQTEFLMYAWTAPMEILSTKDIYNESLLGLSAALYKNLNKGNFTNYTEFIYSMLFVNMINENIVVKKDTAINGMSKYMTLGISALAGLSTSEDKKGLEEVCKEVLSSYTDTSANEYLAKNIASTLGIDKEKLDKDISAISKKNNLFESAVLFDKNVKNLNEVSIIDNPLNDSWYIAIREYMELQDDFYKMKKEIDKIIKILTVLPDTERKVAILKQGLFDVDALYRKFDETVRYNIIDLPVSIYADLYYIEFRKGKKWYDDDEKAMGDIAVAYNKACANMQKYMVSEFAINKVMRITRTLKKEFNEDEWKEVKTRAKLTQDWFNMLNKVKIENK